MTYQIVKTEQDKEPMVIATTETATLEAAYELFRSLVIGEISKSNCTPDIVKRNIDEMLNVEFSSNTPLTNYVELTRYDLAVAGKAKKAKFNIPDTLDKNTEIELFSRLRNTDSYFYRELVSIGLQLDPPASPDEVIELMAQNIRNDHPMFLGLLSPARDNARLFSENEEYARELRNSSILVGNLEFELEDLQTRNLELNKSLDAANTNFSAAMDEMEKARDSYIKYSTLYFALSTACEIHKAGKDSKDYIKADKVLAEHFFASPSYRRDEMPDLAYHLAYNVELVKNEN